MSLLLPPPEQRTASEACSRKYTWAMTLSAALSVPLGIYLGLVGVALLLFVKPDAERIGQAALDWLMQRPIVEEAVRNQQASHPLIQDVLPETFLERLRVPFWVLVALLSVGFAWRVYAQSSRTSYALTATHIYVARRALSRRAKATSLAQVTGIDLYQSLTNRLLGVWTVELSTRGRSILVHGVKDPLPLLAAFKTATARDPTPVAVLMPDVGPAWAERLSWRGYASIIATHAIIPALSTGGPSLLEAFGVDAGGGLAPLIVGGAAALIGLGIFLHHAGSKYELRDGTIRVRRGILGIREHRMDLARISNVELKRSPIARLFRCGSIKLTSESGATITPLGIPDPEHAYETLDRLRRGHPA